MSGRTIFKLTYRNITSSITHTVLMENVMLEEQVKAARVAEEVVVRLLPAALGAEVICGKLTELGPQGRATIFRAWLEHLVLVFRNQDLSDAEQIKITDIFGEPEEAVLYEDKGKHKGVVVISNQPGGMLGSSEMRWHSDHAFHEKPLSASMLHAKAIPPTGGDTSFCNMYLALATLSAPLRERVRGRTVKNDGSLDSTGALRGKPVTDILTYEGPSHPIIRTIPETGYNVLYLGKRPNAYINGMSLEESEDVLNQLWAHAANPAFEYRHKWNVGDVVVWDNRTVMHKRQAFDENLRRVMHRTQCGGERPFYQPDADARGDHPRGFAARPRVQ